MDKPAAWSLEELRQLRTIIDRIIPADLDHPGALASGTDRYVLARLSEERRDWAPGVRSGLGQLPPLADLCPLDLVRCLELHEGEVWFLNLIELTQEGFYANPANGGNAGAASWAMIGYEHRLPEGPDGPPARKASGG